MVAKLARRDHARQNHVIDHQDGRRLLAGRFFFNALCRVHDPEQARGEPNGAADSSRDSGQGKQKG